MKVATPLELVATVAGKVPAAELGGVNFVSKVPPRHDGSAWIALADAVLSGIE